MAMVQNNPALHHFKLHLGNTGPKVGIRIIDNNGRLIERMEISSGAKTVSIGEKYRSGIYFAQITSGMYTKTVKLVKL
jgi:hypothetical protein